MNRRTMLHAVAAGGLMGLTPAEAATRPIHLHVDLFVTPGREDEMKQNFLTVFKPVLSKQPGFVRVQLLKLRSELSGKAPVGASYRLIISFETEEQRLAWVATDDHQRVWPEIGKTLTAPNVIVILYDEI
jgi:heme-degrading monooxygenase HmoA